MIFYYKRNFLTKIDHRKILYVCEFYTEIFLRVYLSRKHFLIKTQRFFNNLDVSSLTLENSSSSTDNLKVTIRKRTRNSVINQTIIQETSNNHSNTLIASSLINLILSPIPVNETINITSPTKLTVKLRFQSHPCTSVRSLSNIESPILNHLSLFDDLRKKKKKKRNVNSTLSLPIHSLFENQLLQNTPKYYSFKYQKNGKNTRTITIFNVA